MKKIIILIALVCGFVTTRCDTVEPKNPTPKIEDTTSIEDFYYNGDTKIPLKRVKNKYFVIYDSAVDLTHLFENAKVTYEEKDKLLPITPYKDFKYSDSTKHCIIECNTSMKEISNNKNIYYVAPVYSNKDTSISALSNIFLVQLKPENDINLLETLASENNVKIAGTLIFSPKFYFLICDKNSNGNALEMANLFYETGNFISCTPDLLSNQDPYECVNDANFWSQWGLKNTTNLGNGIDIKYCNARNITQGNSNVIVAVVDAGIDMNHPDITNIYSISYDTETNTSPSKVHGVHGHGTHVAGIIGANTNNNIGIAGIAPNCPLMSISNSGDATLSSAIARASGIDFAWQNGASVINCSWISSYIFPAMDTAIKNALTKGRGGKGCVVVFVSGNDNSMVTYPANSNPDILVVGAIDSYINRWSNSTYNKGSNYGTELDIVAPGVDIYSTILNGSYDYKIGTSMAAPHVAGVAALMLSVNPDLTQKQVADIIEQTAQKIKPNIYFYDNEPGRLNGTWNNEIGYGLVDAYESVKKASCWKNIHNQIISTNKKKSGCIINVKDTTINSDKKLTIDVTKEAILESDFEVQVGAELEINIIP